MLYTYIGSAMCCWLIKKWYRKVTLSIHFELIIILEMNLPSEGVQNARLIQSEWWLKLWNAPRGVSHNRRMCLSFTGIHVPVILKHGFCLGHRVFHTIRCNRVHEYYTLFLLNRVYYLNITSTTYILRLFLPNTLFTLLAYTYITLSQSHRIRISTTTGSRRPPCRNSSQYDRSRARVSCPLNHHRDV